MSEPLPRIEILSVDTDGPLRVRLRRGERVVEALASTDDAGLEAAALIALSALADLLPGTITVALDELHVVDGRREAVVVFLTARVAGVPLPHVGSALVGDDPQLATVRAVLDALNRRLEILGA